MLLHRFLNLTIFNNLRNLIGENMDELIDIFDDKTEFGKPTFYSE